MAVLDLTILTLIPNKKSYSKWKDKNRDMIFLFYFLFLLSKLYLVLVELTNCQNVKYSSS